MVKDNIIPNHMDIYWHDYTGHVKDKPITEASVPVKAALIGRVGLMLLSCGTGAWRVRSAMNLLSESLGVTCTASIGLMTIVYTCFDGHKTFTNSLALNNTGVNTLKLDKLTIPYRILGCAFAIIGSVGALSVLWNLFDFFFGVCAVLNLIVCFLMRKQIGALINDYLARLKSGKWEPTSEAASNAIPELWVNNKDKA